MGQGIIEESSEGIDSATELLYFLSYLFEGLISASLSEELYNAFFDASAIYCIFSIFSVIAAIAAFVIAIILTPLFLMIWYLPFLIPAILVLLLVVLHLPSFSPQLLPC